MTSPAFFSTAAATSSVNHHTFNVSTPSVNPFPHPTSFPLRPRAVGGGVGNRSRALAPLVRGSFAEDSLSSSAAAASSSATVAVLSVEEEKAAAAEAKIGARVRVKVPLKVYHVPKVPEVDLTGREGVLKTYVAVWKGKRISANLPFKVEFVVDVEGRGPVKFFAHLKEDEFEYLD